jgi:hypothetical protein
MIVYRDHRREAEPRTLLEQLRISVEQLDVKASNFHDATVDAFISAGTLESAMADAIFTEADGIHPLTNAFRAVSVGLGHVLWHCWRAAPDQAERWLSGVVSSLDAVEHHRLPSPLTVTVPEGFAYYAVYPEAYLEAARKCHATLGNASAVCIGLRSIGVTLAGAVAAALEELGRPVRSFTLRPRGHPFSRRPVLEPALEQLIVEDPASCFLLIDEGPGISGSSLAGTAEVLGRLGIPDDRIVLFPSWSTDGAQLRSEQARDHWRRHHQFSVSFEELWIETGRFDQIFPGCRWEELSAGCWRPKLYPHPEHYPAVQPQHERRKYLLHGPPGQGACTKLLSFSGLGGRSGPIVQRAERLAEAGFTPRPEGTAHGFLIRSFVPGTPVGSGKMDEELVETVAGYLAHLSTRHLAEPRPSGDSLRAMVVTNVAEGLGDSWLTPLHGRLPSNFEEWSERPVAPDGRMLAHEWIRTEDGFLKTDAFDHHDDHFFPGYRDIAWDVVGAVLELGLDPGGRRSLVDQYRELSGDRLIRARLPVYALAYLAYRLGYASLATSVLGDSPDGRRFATATERYRKLLRRELTQSAAAGWDV